MVNVSMKLSMPVFHFQVPLDLKKELAAKIISSINNRIFLKSISGNNQLLEDNTPFTLDLKEKFGQYLIPLVATGDMTRKDAWETRMTNDGFVIRLQEQHQTKWRNIVKIAEKSGKINWTFAYTLGQSEKTIITNVINQFMKNKSDKFFEVSYVK